MSKLIKINDRKPIEIYIGRKTRGPINNIRLSDAVICRLLHSVDAPKDIYAIGPNNRSVKLTLDNYMKTEEELFNIKPVDPVVNEDDAKAKAEILRKTLEAKKNAEPEVKETKSEIETPVTEEKVSETTDETKVQTVETVVNESVENEVTEVEKTEVKEPEVAKVIAEQKAIPVKNYNNHNHYNKNHNKNRK